MLSLSKDLPKLVCITTPVAFITFFNDNSYFNRTLHIVSFTMSSIEISKSCIFYFKFIILFLLTSIASLIPSITKSLGYSDIIFTILLSPKTSSTEGNLENNFLLSNIITLSMFVCIYHLYFIIYLYI